MNAYNETQKRILVLNYEFPPLGGGASPVCDQVARRLVEQEQCIVDVVTMGYRGLPAHEEEIPGLNIHRVKCLRSKKEICYPYELISYLISAYFKCRSLLDEYRYDICHTHFLIPTGLLAWLIKKFHGLHYVVTCHGSDIPGYNEDRFTFLHRFTRPFLRTVAKGADKVIAPSMYLKKLILKNVDADLEKDILFVPNGIDPNNYTPREKKAIILSTGRLLPRKGFQYLIAAVSDLALEHELHICGDGPMLDELQGLATNSRTKIVFHGWIDNNGEEYRNLLESAAIYCLVSSKENASISLLEAMSAGCAVITSNVSGCPETVENSGMVIPPRSIEDIRNSLEYLITNPEYTRNLGVLARERVSNELNWSNIVKQYKCSFFGRNGRDGYE